MNLEWCETILNTNRDASEKEIKTAFRKQSIKYHPDRNNNSEKFDQLTKAYNLLIEYKNKYPISNAIIPQESIFQSNLPDIIKKNVTVNFYQIYKGTTIPLLITRNIAINNKVYQEEETIYIDILPGTDHNEIIVIKNKGNKIDNISSDIKVFVKLENNTQFKRDGLDIILEKSITLKEALCGFEFNIELLNNKTYNIVNKDYIISPGYSKVIQNLGFIRNKSVGDLIIKFTIKFPTTISESTLEYLKNHL